MTLDLMDGLVHQELRVSLEFQAGQEEQDLMETLGIKVSLVPEGILGIMEIGYSSQFNLIYVASNHSSDL